MAANPWAPDVRAHARSYVVPAGIAPLARARDMGRANPNPNPDPDPDPDPDPKHETWATQGTQGARDVETHAPSAR